MVEINYNTNKYDILVEEGFSDYKGTYRVVQYDTGYYALQKLVPSNTILNPLDSDAYVTVLVSPLIDKKLTLNDEDKGEDVLDIPLGKQYIEEVFESIKEADRSFNGKYWELRLFLSEMGEENFTEIITKGEGETLLGQIDDLLSLEEEQRLSYLENYNWIMGYKIIIIVLFVALIVSWYYFL